MDAAITVKSEASIVAVRPALIAFFHLVKSNTSLLLGLVDCAEGAPSVRIGPTAPSPAPIRLTLPLLPSGNPERQDAHCAPRGYGDGDGPPDGGGVRRGFSVGDGLGSGVGDGVGSAVALGDGSTDGLGVGVGSAVGLGAGLAETVGSAVAVGAGVATGSGVAEATGLGRGVAMSEGSADWAAGTNVSVGVATGGMVARGGVNGGNCATNCEAANTKAPPSRATDRIVTTSVPVVRMAPRMTWLRRSDSQDRFARRLGSIVERGEEDPLVQVDRGARDWQRPQ